tara:strand:+ start:19 stop:852 length:834 start_codon:yes stop_codon:yes gene_type:complete
MELKFDKKRFRVKYCPCNKSNKDGKFVPYENQVKYGYCHSCDKTYLPEKDNTIEKYIPPVKQTVFDLIDPDLVVRSWDSFEINHFAIFLKKMFGSESDELIKKFMLGTSSDNGVVFWQIDEKMRTRTGKVMAYNPNTGKRIKDVFPTWVHKIYNQTYQQCFFGLHQIKDRPGSQDIHIVESEKTAIIMSYFHPEIIWLASGGSTGLQTYKFEALKGRKVCLFPDQGKYELWNEQMERLQFEYPSIYFYPTSVECELWHKENILKDGGDIADYYLRLG